MFKNKSIGLFILSALISTFPAIAYADSVTGTVNVKITLTGGCLVGTDPIQENDVLGDIDFGSHSTLFDQADGQLLNSSASALEVRCNSTIAPTFTVVNGVNDAQGGSYNHAMANSSVYVPYSLYSDAGRSQIVNNGSAFFTSANDGSVETVNLYARAYNPNTPLTVGDYTDILTIRIDF